jgi:hypothetical protein
MRLVTRIKREREKKKRKVKKKKKGKTPPYAHITLPKKQRKKIRQQPR